HLMRALLPIPRVRRNFAASRQPGTNMSHTSSLPMPPSVVSGAGAVLVCGLGTLGIECVRTLRGYGLPVRAVDRESDGLLQFPDAAVVRGDCREAEVLRKADLETCRAVLLVTGDSRANIEAAMTARRLKPSVRIVARAAERSLGELMATFLGDFVC